MRSLEFFFIDLPATRPQFRPRDNDASRAAAKPDSRPSVEDPGALVQELCIAAHVSRDGTLSSGGQPAFERPRFVRADRERRGHSRRSLFDDVRLVRYRAELFAVLSRKGGE